MQVDSTAIDEIVYDPRRSVLDVTFVSGDHYAYWPVPRAVHRAFVEADSKGRFFQARIRDHYDYRRIN